MPMNLKANNSRFEPFNSLTPIEKVAIFELIDFKVNDEMKEVFIKLEQFNVKLDQIKLETKSEIEKSSLAQKLEDAKSRNHILVWNFAIIATFMVIALILAIIKFR